MNSEKSSQFKLSLSVGEAAAATGMSRATIHKLCNTGELTRRKVGKRTFILVDELEAFMRARGQGKWAPTVRRVAENGVQS